MLPTLSPPGSIDQFFQRLETTLAYTWQEGAFGHLAIESKRCYQTVQEVLLLDSTAYLFTFTNEDITVWKATLARSRDTATSLKTVSAIEQLFLCLESRLLRTWEETGYGRLEVNCDRTGRSKIRILISGAPSYCFHLDDGEVQQWLGER